MSRNGSGTYTLPTGNPVTTGTTISSTWANNTLSDIANAITQSVSADGQTPITGPLVGPSGTVAFGGTGQTQIPSGTTAQRSASPVNGMIRYNTDLNIYEGYRSGSWLPIISSNANSIVYNEGGTGAVDQTVQKKLQESVSVKDFGAVGDGVTNDTAAFAAALAASYNVFVPPGTYLTNIAIPVPSGSADGLTNAYSLIGTTATILQQYDNTLPVIYKATTNTNRLYHGTIGPFVVKPHASGTTQPAIKVVGFTYYTFNRIRGISNGIKGFASLFYNSAYPSFSYLNTFNEPTLESQIGYTKVFDFQNDGQGATYNSNGATINNLRVYNNTGLSIAVDANNSYGVWLNQASIENNSGAIGVKMGQGTKVNQGDFEANGNHFDYTGSYAAIYTCVQDTYLGTATNINFTSSAYGNTWINVWEAGGTCTWVSSYGQYNQKIKFGVLENPNAETWAYVSGVTGSLGFVSRTLIVPANQLTRTANVKGVEQWTSSGAGYTVLQVTPATNVGTWQFATLSATVTDTGSGVSLPCSVGVDGKISFNATGANVYYINYYMTLYLP